MDEGTRGELLDRLAGAIEPESVTTSHPLRVAVDGPPAVGKTPGRRARTHADIIVHNDQPRRPALEVRPHRC
jgi:hypothetical protein